MTILAKFPLGTFKCSNKLNYNFDYYYKMAEKGAQHNGTNYLKIILIMLCAVAPFILFFIILSIVASKIKVKSITNPYLGKIGNKIPKGTPIFRDIPCRGDIFRAYFIAYNYNLMKKKTDFLGAVLLKWLSENIISIKAQSSKKDEISIVFNHKKSVNFEDTNENDLYFMFYTASKDGILEKKEFKKWCSKNYSKILNWFDKVILAEKSKLIEEGKIEKTNYKKSIKYTADNSLMDEAKEIYGLRKFFKEYTLINEREAIEFRLFEQYLMFAQLLGIAKKVASQFKKLYPDIIEQYNYNFDDILFVHSISNSVISRAYSAKNWSNAYSNSNYRASSYSSGGGGFSSGGGRRWFFWWPVEVAGGFR